MADAFPNSKVALQRFKIAWADFRLALAERRLTRAHETYWKRRDALRLAKHKEAK